MLGTQGPKDKLMENQAFKNTRGVGEILHLAQKDPETGHPIFENACFPKRPKCCKFHIQREIHLDKQ